VSVVVEGAPIIWVCVDGQKLAPHRTNGQRCSCKLCGAALAPGQGVRRRMDYNRRGTGYICPVHVGEQIRRCERYMYNRSTAGLLPYEPLAGPFAIPAETLAQAWEQGGAAALRSAAEQGREAARRAWLAAADIPYVPDRY
jgi:hypothetical protein